MATKAPPRKLDHPRSRKLCGYTAFLAIFICMFLICFFFLDIEIIYSNAGMLRPEPVLLQRDYGLASSAAHESEENSTSQVATPIVEVITSSDEDTEEVGEVFKAEDVAPQVGEAEPAEVESIAAEEVASSAAHESEENSTTQVATPIVEVITSSNEDTEEVGEVFKAEDVAPQVGEAEPAEVESIAAEEVASSAAHESEENSTTQVATPIVEVITSSNEDTEEVGEVFKAEDVAPQVGEAEPAEVESIAEEEVASSAAHESEENSTTQVATPIVEVITSSDEDTEEVGEVFKAEDVAPQVGEAEPAEVETIAAEEIASSAAHKSEENSTTSHATSPVVEVISTLDKDTDSKTEEEGEDVEPQVGMEPAQEERIAAEDVIIPEGDGEEEETVPETVESVLELPREARPLAGCNITQGSWVFDNVTYPLYRTRNCPFADLGFRCEDNGRPDKEFMSYHWQPHDCDLPRFNATDILERLRGQRMVFVGDSLGRNTWESMMCMLAEGVADKRKIYEVNGNPITKHSGKLVYRFVDYDCTVEYYREPFLVPQTRAPRHSPANVTGVLRVDHVCWSADQWKNADYIIFNAGHWWTENKIFRQGCGFQEGSSVKHYDLRTGLGKALQTWATWLERNLNSKKTQVFWLSFPTVHFRGGSWNRGGHCHQERRPLTEEEARNEWQTPYQNQVVQDELMARLKKTLSSVTYLDITTATNYRPDGHGALYTWDTKKFGLKPRNHQDCSHFCLPGVPDAWNELILGSLFAKGKGTWVQPVKLKI